MSSPYSDDRDGSGAGSDAFDKADVGDSEVSALNDGFEPGNHNLAEADYRDPDQGGSTT